MSNALANRLNKFMLADALPRSNFEIVHCVVPASLDSSLCDKPFSIRFSFSFGIAMRPDLMLQNVASYSPHE